MFHYDELFTAERAREMLVRDDFLAVTFNFEPDFKKPPLQYWVTALCLRILPGDREFAARLPATLCGALCLLALGWAARRCLASANPATALASVGALGLYGPFIHHSRHALLDPGATLLLLVLLVCCHLARTEPRWWAAAAAAAVLGAMQKEPFGLAAWGLILILRWQSGEFAQRRADRCWLAFSFGAAVLLTLAWPIWEAVRFGLGGMVTFAEYQGRDLLAPPRSTGFAPWLYWWWLIRDWAVLGAVAPIAIVLAVAGRWRRILPPRWRMEGESGVFRARFLQEISWVCLVFAGAVACLPRRTERYLVLIAPLLALVTVAFVAELLRSRFPPRTDARRSPAVAWALVAVLACAAPTAWFHYTKPGKARADLLPPARALGEAARHEFATDAAVASRQVFVDEESSPDFHTLGFLLFYGELGQPIHPLPKSPVTGRSALFSPGEAALVLRWERESLHPTTPTNVEVLATGTPEDPWILLRFTERKTAQLGANFAPRNRAIAFP